MSRIHLNLPMLADASQLGRLEPHADHTFKKELYEGFILGLDHFKPNGSEDLKRCFGIILPAPPKNVKNTFEKTF